MAILRHGLSSALRFATVRPSSPLHTFGAVPSSPIGASKASSVPLSLETLSIARTSSHRPKSSWAFAPQSQASPRHCISAQTPTSMVTKSSHTSLFPQCKSRAILQQVRAYHQDNETREENLKLRNSVRQDIDGIEKELAEHRRALHQHKFILNIFVVSFGFVLGILCSGMIY